MPDGRKKKTVKTIKVILDRCNGCRACEIACSAFHARPKYSSVNPARSRIRVIVDMLNDEYVPIRAAGYTATACQGRRVYTINSKQYSECSFCGAICPTRDLFKEPDSGLPLKCDLCEDDPPFKEPLCVQACPPGALVYEEKDEEAEEEAADAGREALETGLQTLIDNYGVQKVAGSLLRMLQKE